MKNKIRNIMATIFEVEENQLKDNVTQKEIENWDSLRHLNLVVELEEAFNVSYEPEEIAEMTSMEKIVTLTEIKRKKIV